MGRDIPAVSVRVITASHHNLIFSGVNKIRWLSYDAREHFYWYSYHINLSTVFTAMKTVIIPTKHETDVSQYDHLIFQLRHILCIKLQTFRGIRNYLNWTSLRGCGFMPCDAVQVGSMLPYVLAETATNFFSAFLWPCIVTNLLYNQLDAAISQIYSGTNTLNVSDSSSVPQHQEFIHCTLSNGIWHTGL
jgi:hypothetical protein